MLSQLELLTTPGSFIQVISVTNRTVLNSMKGFFNFFSLLMKLFTSLFSFLPELFTFNQWPSDSIYTQCVTVTNSLCVKGDNIQAERSSLTFIVSVHCLE